MRDFTYQSLPMHVIFRSGSAADLRSELQKLGLSRVVVLSTPFEALLATQLSAPLEETCAGLYPKAAQHVPTEVAAEAWEFAQAVGADGFVTVGGGSSTGLGKAIALRSDLPVVSVPTTYAGSEMTTIWGTTENGEKKTGRDIRVLPKAVIYDPLLTLSLPTAISVTSGFNAIAHAVEGLYAPDASPITGLMAAEGIRSLVQALPLIVQDNADIAARSDALYGAWLCGATLGATTMGLHHKLCHVLGGTFNMPHAETHTVVLPYVMRFNQSAALGQLQEATGFHDPAHGIRELSVALGAPRSLRELGLTEDAIEQVVRLATASPYANPVPIEPSDVHRILSDALEGTEV